MLHRPHVTRSHRHGLSTLELVAVLVTIGILTAFAGTLGAVRLTHTFREHTALESLRSITAAETTWHDTYGAWMPLSEVRALDNRGTAVTGPSTSPRHYSIADGTIGPYDVVGIAVITENGTCVTIRQQEHAAGQPAETWAYLNIADLGYNCDGNLALTPQPGREPR